MRIHTLEESIHSAYGNGEEKPSLDSSSVGFAKLQIREYARRVGDNPSCSGGPPIALSWEYDPETIEVPVDEFEENRGPRRTAHEMAMPRAMRQELLMTEWGASSEEIACAVRANNRIKNSRRRTVHNLGSSTSKVEERMEGIRKGLKRRILRKKKVSEQYLEWKREADRAAAAIAEEYAAAEALGLDDAEAGRAAAVIAEENAAAATTDADAAAAAPCEAFVINEDDGDDLGNDWVEADRGSHPALSTRP